MCIRDSDVSLSDYLVHNHSFSPAEANFAAVFGQGSYLRALEAMNTNMKDLRFEIVSTCLLYTSRCV